MPSEPVSIAASSDSMSPNRLSVTMTSNCLGLRTSCMAQLSAYMCVSSTSGTRRRAACLHLLAPQHAGLHHVGLLDRAHLVAALARQLEGDARRRGRSRRSYRPACRRRARLPSGSGLDAARLAEIDAAGQLAHDHDVEARARSRASASRHRPARRSTIAGRRLANSRISLRRRSRPRSGFAGRTAGCPISARRPRRTAPHRRASASAIVSSGERRAVRVDGGAADQAFLDLEADARACASIQSMTRLTSAITSGPMPSPARIRSFLFGIAGILRDRNGRVLGVQSVVEPGLRGLLLAPRSRRSCRRLLQGQADIVEAVQQACLRKGSISKWIVPPSGGAISCFSRSMVMMRIGAALGIVHQLVDLLARQHDRQDAVLEAVVVEDVGEAGRDDAADAEIQQRPGRVLARRAAAEILAGDEDLGLAVGRLVQHEIRVLAAVRRRSASRRTGSCRGRCA